MTRPEYHHRAVGWEFLARSGFSREIRIYELERRVTSTRLIVVAGNPRGISLAPPEPRRLPLETPRHFL